MFGTKILEERKSKINGEIKVIRALGLGTYIQAGNLTQSGGIIESMWKQTLKKVRARGLEVKRCLILGLGGGTVVKLIHKNWPNAKIVGVDIDPVIVDLGKKYLRLDISKVDVKIADAYRFTKLQALTSKTYDLVVVDLYNGDQFPKKFGSQSYIQVVRSLLAESGVAVFNRLYYKDKKIEAENFGKKLKKVFTNIEEYYPLVNLMFVCVW
jgi:spermidine synthase